MASQHTYSKAGIAALEKSLEATMELAYSIELDGATHGLDIAARKTLRSAGFSCRAQLAKIKMISWPDVGTVGKGAVPTPSEVRDRISTAGITAQGGFKGRKKA